MVPAVLFSYYPLTYRRYITQAPVLLLAFAASEHRLQSIWVAELQPMMPRTGCRKYHPRHRFLLEVAVGIFYFLPAKISWSMAFNTNLKSKTNPESKGLSLFHVLFPSLVLASPILLRSSILRVFFFSFSPYWIMLPPPQRWISCSSTTLLCCPVMYASYASCSQHCWKERVIMKLFEM